MSETLPRTGEPNPLSDDELDRVSGGTLPPESQEKPQGGDPLPVQMSIQRENQVYTSVSNVLKTRHDTVKNSIGN
jgi:hypothetical protein